MPPTSQSRAPAKIPDSARPTIPSGTTFTKANHTRTLLLLTGVLLVLTLIAWLILTLISGEIRRQITATLDSTRAIAIANALGFLTRQRETAKAVVAAPVLHRSALAVLGGDRGELETLVGRFDALLPSQQFDGWALARPDGTIIASGQRAAGWSVLPMQLHSRVGEVMAGKPLLLAPGWVPEGVDGKRPAFLCAVPLTADDRVAGIIALTMDPLATLSHTLETARFGDTGETYACTTDGFIASRSRYLEDLKGAGLVAEDASTSILRLALRRPPQPLRPGVVPDGNPAEWPFTTAAAGIMAGRPGVSLDGTDYRGVPVVVAWSPLDGFGFGVITKIDRSEAFRPLAILRTIFLSVFALLALVAVAGVFWIASLARLRNKLDKAKGHLQELGQYTLERKIGEGGMGAVYLGRHAMMRRPTAIKLITGSVGPDALARFEREVQLSCRLSHPNTIAIYDYGRTADGTFYYAMELLDGMDLEEMVKRFGPLVPGRVIHLLAQACGSLAEAHDLRMIHRDIKPANLFITRRGGERDVLKVLDFGLVKSLSNDAPQLSRADVISGTPPYMAPEVIGQKAGIDGRSDLYALACVGYFMLTGICPFERDSAMDTLMAHLNETAKPMAQVTGIPIPADLERAIMHALARDPDQRPRDLRAWRDELLACADARAWREADADGWWAMNGSAPAVPKGQEATAIMSPLPGLVIRTADFEVGKTTRSAPPIQ